MITVITFIFNSSTPQGPCLLDWGPQAGFHIWILSTAYNVISHSWEHCVMSIVTKERKSSSFPAWCNHWPLFQGWVRMSALATSVHQDRESRKELHPSTKSRERTWAMGCESRGPFPRALQRSQVGPSQSRCGELWRQGGSWGSCQGLMCPGNERSLGLAADGMEQERRHNNMANVDPGRLLQQFWWCHPQVLLTNWQKLFASFLITLHSFWSGLHASAG